MSGIKYTTRDKILIVVVIAVSISLVLIGYHMASSIGELKTWEEVINTFK